MRLYLLLVLHLPAFAYAGLCSHLLQTSERSGYARASMQNYDCARAISSFMNSDRETIVHLILEYSLYDPQRILSEGRKILAVDWGYLLTTKSFMELAPSALSSSPLAANIFQSYMMAFLLDGLFASVEGSESLSIESSDNFKTLFKKINTATLERTEKPARFTPIGMPTDDSQFLAAGILARELAPNDFARTYLNLWKDFDQKGLWRNTGPRLKAFLANEHDALRGEATLGDILRVIPFSVLSSNPTLMRKELDQYAQILNLTPEQSSFNRSFLEIYTSFLKNEDVLPALNASIKNISNQKMIFFLETLRDQIVVKGNLFSYLEVLSTETRDYDTIAFIGGLFLGKNLLTLFAEDWQHLRLQESYFLLAAEQALQSAQVEHFGLLLPNYFEQEKKLKDLLNKMRSTDPTELRKLLNQQ